MDGRGIARHGYPVVDNEGTPIGHVTSGTRSPSLGENIGLAYVPWGQHKIGSALTIMIRDRAQTATIVKAPFI